MIRQRWQRLRLNEGSCMAFLSRAEIKEVQAPVSPQEPISPMPRPRANPKLCIVLGSPPEGWTNLIFEDFTSARGPRLGVVQAGEAMRSQQESVSC